MLGKDGHHQLEEAIIYRAGDRKGQVFARGVLTHNRGEHTNLDLGTIRRYLIVHNVVGAAYIPSRGRALRNLTRPGTCTIRLSWWRKSSIYVIERVSFGPCLSALPP